MTDTASRHAEFERMLDLEQAEHTHHALAMMGSDAATRERGELNYRKTREQARELMSSWDLDTLRAFRDYRREIRGL